MNKAKSILKVAFLSGFVGAFALTSTVFGQVQPENNIAVDQTPGNFVSYNSHGGRYSFNYPPTWVTYDQPNNVFPYVRVSNLDPDSLDSTGINSKFFKIEIVTLPNPDNLTLADWVQNYIADESPVHEVLEKTEIQVAGLPAINTGEKVGDFVFSVTYIMKDGDVYLVVASNISAEFTPALKTVLNSLAFISN